MPTRPKQSPDNQPRGIVAPARAEQTGVDGLIAGVSSYVAEALQHGYGSAWFVRQVAEQYAYIRLQDIGRPLRFLRQMAGQPPIAFGARGFRRSLVDDKNPARHYMAFVFLGFWLPRLLAVLSLWLWEIAGYVRYHGLWSQRDVRNGYVGLRHGRLVRRYGPAILPGLIAAEVAEPPTAPGQTRLTDKETTA
jgi:hypothetical protein